MKLNDIYGKLVANKGSITPLTTTNSPSYLPIKERDPKSIQLEANIAKKMNDAVNQQLPKTEQLKPSLPPHTVKQVSYEEAIKELVELEKKKET